MDIEKLLIECKTDTESCFHFSGIKLNKIIQIGTIINCMNFLSTIEMDHINWVVDQYTNWLNENNAVIETSQLICCEYNSEKLSQVELTLLMSDKIIFKHEYIILFYNIQSFKLIPQGGGVKNSIASILMDATLQPHREKDQSTINKETMIESVGISLYQHGKYTTEPHMLNCELLTMNEIQDFDVKNYKNLWDLINSLPSYVIADCDEVGKELERQVCEVYENEHLGYCIEGNKNCGQIPDAKTQDYWDNRHNPINQCILPLSKRIRVYSHLEPIGTRIKQYIAMKLNPSFARSSLVDMVFEELNSFTNRQGSIQLLQTKKINVEIEVNTFIDNYFDKLTWPSLKMQYKSLAAFNAALHGLPTEAEARAAGEVIVTPESLEAEDAAAETPQEQATPEVPPSQEPARMV